MRTIAEQKIRNPQSEIRNRNPDLSVDFAGIKLKNPVLTASGTFGYGEEFAEFVDLNKLGGVIVKGVSLKPIKGNPPPRIWETPSGMLNAIGLENPGVDVFLSEKLPYLRKLRYRGDREHLRIQSRRVRRRVPSGSTACPGMSGLEVNISCPNVKAGGIVFGTERQGGLRTALRGPQGHASCRSSRSFRRT